MSREGKRGDILMQREEAMKNDDIMKDMAQRDERAEKVLENRAADKKAFGKFILLLAISLIAGFGLGIATAATKGKQDMLIAGMKKVIMTIAPFGSIVVTTIVMIVTGIWIKQSRKLYATWDGEDEDLIDKVERKLTYGIIITSTNMILGYLFFSMGIYSTDSDDPTQLYSVIRMIGTFGGLIYTMFVGMVLQKSLVNFTKEINPEKRGSVYDTKFQKNWLESCDESEQKQVHQAGFAAWRMGTNTCLGLWVFTFIGMMAWDFGMMPVLMVITIWLVMTIRYHVECVRLSKH